MSMMHLSTLCLDLPDNTAFIAADWMNKSATSREGALRNYVRLFAHEKVKEVKMGKRQGRKSVL